VSWPGLGLALISLLGLITGVNGLWGAPSELAAAPSTLALIVEVLNVLLGITGLLVAVLAWRKSRAAIPVAWVWGPAAVAASLLAPRAYAPEAGWRSAITGAFLTLLIVVGILIFLRRKLSGARADDDLTESSAVT
jgi:hypothetical protein